MNTRRMIVLAMLLLSGAVAAFAAPAAPGVTDSNEASGQPLPLIGRISKPRGVPDPGLVEAGQNANEAITQGEALFRQGKTEAALSSFRNAMQYLPNDPLALQRIAETYVSMGRLMEANQTYYKLFHEANWQSVGGNSSVYLGYALVLAKTGQTELATEFYQEGAARLNYIDGKPNLKVMLPAFGDGEGQVPFSPQALQAMAHVGIGVYSQDFKEKLAHLDAAIKLQPDMPQAYYYKGQVLYGMSGRSRAALAAYQQARHFAGIDTQLLIDQVIQENELEKAAAQEQAREKPKARPTK